MADAISGRQLVATPVAVGIRSVNFFDMTGPHGSSFGWPLQVGVTKDSVEGDPATPCIILKQPGAWRFRWGVEAGARSIAVYCKQVDNTSPYPSLVIKANTDAGINADVETFAAAGAGWKTIGPVAINPSGYGVLWIELRNNYRGSYDSTRATGSPWSPCYFDHIVTT
jgi:hypothetical protein